MGPAFSLPDKKLQGKTMSKKEEFQKVFLNVGTRIAGEHCEPGTIVECDDQFAAFLCTSNKGEPYDPAKHDQKKGKASK